LRFIWPSSEGHLYREQKRLVALGWAKATAEANGRRKRTRYSITTKGRRALKDWLATEPESLGFEVEGIVRTFFGDLGTVQSLVSSMHTTAGQARSRLDELLDFVDDYLETGGPFPERLHVVALAVEVLAEQLSSLEAFFTTSAEEVGSWSSSASRPLDADTRQRLEGIRNKHRR